MSENSEILTWWRANLADRESGRARALAARLRRANSVEVLAEPEVHELAAKIQVTSRGALLLVRLVQALAEVRENASQRLAQRLGGREAENRRMSPLRFQRLLRSREDEFATQVRRAVAMADRTCNVPALAGDILRWDHPDRGDDVRIRWSFDYFAAAAIAKDDDTAIPEASA